MTNSDKVRNPNRTPYKGVGNRGMNCLNLAFNCLNLAQLRELILNNFVPLKK